MDHCCGNCVSVPEHWWSLIDVAFVVPFEND